MVNNDTLNIERKWMPLSPEQELFWLYYRFTGDSLNIIFKIELGTDTKPTVVNERFNAFIARHDIFWFQAAAYSTRQRLMPRYRIDVEVGRYTKKDRCELDGVMKELREPFLLFKGPRIRATLMENPNATYTLYVAAPHMVMDFHTVVHIKRTLTRLLNDDDEVSNPAASYTAYISNRNAKANALNRRDNINYWKKALNGAEQFRLPRKYVSTGPDNLRSVHLRFSPQRYAIITGAARKLGIPDAVFLYACIYTALHLLIDQPFFVFPFMFAVNRNGDLAETLGPMIGLLPIGHRFSAEHSLTETLTRIYRLVKEGHKQRRFVPHIDLIEASPNLLDSIPLKYRLLLPLYSLVHSFFGKLMISPQKLYAAIGKTKTLGLDTFAKQPDEPYTLMFNPRMSKEMRAEVYSLWITNETHSLGMSSDDEAIDYRPEGIYFSLNYDIQDNVEFHSTPFINPEGAERFTCILETIFSELTNGNDPRLKDVLSLSTVNT